MNKREKLFHFQDQIRRNCTDQLIDVLRVNKGRGVGLWRKGERGGEVYIGLLNNVVHMSLSYDIRVRTDTR